MKNIRSMGKGLGRRLAGSLVAVALAAVLAAGLPKKVRMSPP